MIATLLSVILVVTLFINPYLTWEIPRDPLIAGFISLIGFFCFFTAAIAFALAWTPLRKAEQQGSPRLITLYLKSSGSRLSHAWLVAFPLLSIGLSIDMLAPGLFDAEMIAGIWLIAFGITIDVLSLSLMRILRFLDPFTYLKYLQTEAESAASSSHDVEFSGWIGALSEVSFHATKEGLLTLNYRALGAIERTIEEFLDVSKSIAHQEADTGVQDTVSFNLFSLFQNLEMIHRTAIEKRLDAISSEVITLLGKLSISVANYDMSLAGHPILYLGRFAEDAREAKMGEIPLKAACCIVESVRQIVNEVDLSYYELKDPFFAMIGVLQQLAKEMFRQDKSTPVKVLKQSLLDIREILIESLASHQDRDAIIAYLDNTLAEFDALDLVMQTVPPEKEE